METTIDPKVSMVMRQTDYTEEEAQQKLLESNGNVIMVIKNYLGITEKKALPKPATSVNQEIYKQLRSKLDESIKTYNLQQEEKLKEELNH
jgi:N-acetylmuramic acid 6-phosphate (MurNAc-6-P) etherase